MADPVMNMTVVVRAKDEASPVLKRLKVDLGALGKGSAGGLGGAGGIAGLASAFPKVASAIGPIVGALSGFAGPIGIVVSGLGAVGSALGKIVSVGVSVFTQVASAVWNLGKSALQFVIGKLQETAKWAAIVGGALTVAAGAFAVSAVQSAAKMEQTKVAYTQLLGSAQKATDFLKQMMDFAAQTPFTFEGLTDSGKRLLAFGFTANQVQPMLTSFGDAMSALGAGGESLDRVIMQLGQMKAKGRAMAEELMPIAEAGVPVFDILKEQLGMTSAQMANLSQSGIDADKVIAALMRGMNKRFGGAMALQMATTAGKFSNLQDAIFQLKVAVGSALLPIVNPAVSALIGLVGKLQAPMERIAARIIAFGRAIMGTKTVQGILNNLGFALGSLIGVFSGKTGGAFNTMEKLIWGAIQKIGVAVQWLVTNVFNPQSLTAIWNWVSNLSAYLGGWLRYIADLFAFYWPQLVAHINGFGKTLSKMWAWVAANLPSIAGGFVTALGTIAVWVISLTSFFGHLYYAIMKAAIAFTMPWAVGGVEAGVKKLQALDREEGAFQGSMQGAASAAAGAAAYGPTLKTNLEAGFKDAASWQTEGGPQMPVWGQRPNAPMSPGEAMPPVTVNISGNVYGVENLQAAIQAGIQAAMRGATYQGG